MTPSRVDWTKVEADLGSDGVAVIPSLLDAKACAELRGRYADVDQFRSRVIMQRHNYGRGEYQYFVYPLPPRVQQLRERIYSRLAPIANSWAEALNQKRRYPLKHSEYIERCHAAGQKRPTPLLLHYGAGDYNCLHQDLYGEHSFPLQMVVLLSEPGKDFSGGELVLVEQRPRMQSRPQVISLQRGDAAIFAVHHRPTAGTRGTYKVNMRHGVSRIHNGERYTLGIIFHDAM